MDTKPFPRVTKVERIDGDLILEFDNGVNALYPASLLAEMLPRATKLGELDPD